MSRNPGIGNGWYQKYKDDIYPQGKVITDGHEAPTPRYYDKLYEKDNPEDYQALLFQRVREARKDPSENTNVRLVVKETVKRAALNQIGRPLESGETQ